MSYPNNRHGNTPPYLLSAYGIAVKHGYSGSEEEWLASLKGDQGEYPRLSYQTPTSGDEVQHGIFYRYADEGDWTNLCWLDDLMTAAEADIINAAKGYADTAEAYAKGTVDGEAVEEGDPGYEDNSKYYAGQASNYASAAGSFAVGASNYAQAASGYATTASGHANNAATSATAAAGSASDAAGSATSASNSAGSASTSASAAEAQATQAGTYAYNADQSAQAAASYAAAANTAYGAVVDVANGVDVKVEDIETQVSIAAGYATNAGTSATNASGSATAAAGSATAAAGSASDAADSATAAAGSATAAAGSATSVSESAAQITTNKNDITDLKNAIDDNLRSKTAESAITFQLSRYDVKKGVVNSSGAVQSDSTRIVTYDFIDVAELDYIEITSLTTNYKYNIAFYSDRNESNFISFLWSNWTDMLCKIPVQCGCIRVQLMLTDTTLTPADISNITVKGYNYKTTAKRIDTILYNKGYTIDNLVDPSVMAFERGTINGDTGATASAVSYIRSSQYLNVASLDELYIVNPAGFRSTIIFYDANNNYIGNTQWAEGASYTIDVSAATYLKMVLGAVPSRTLYKDDYLGLLIFAKLKSVSSSADVREISKNLLFWQGALVNGELQTATTRIATRAYIDVEQSDRIKIIVPDTIYYAVCFYSGVSENTYVYGTPWLQSKQPIDTQGNKYCRITLRYADNTTINQSAAESVAIILQSKKADIVNHLDYEGEHISIGNVVDFINVLGKSAFTTDYAYSTYYQQGAAIYNGIAFMFRHHGACSVFDLKQRSLTNEFLISDITSDNPHCNNASFSKAFPTGNTNFPYVYVGRCNYRNEIPSGQTDSQAQECYVMNITTSGASVVQKIRYDYIPAEYPYNIFDWVVDKVRNKLILYGHSAQTAQSVMPWMFKIFELPEVSEGVVTLTESDVIDEFVFETEQWGYTFGAVQGADINGRYIIMPCSNSDTNQEFVVFIDIETHKLASVFTISKTITGETQAVSCYNGVLYLFSAEGRIDKLIFN